MTYTKFDYKKFFRSFKYAFNGVWYLILNEQNARVHALISIGVGIIAYFLRVSRLEAAILFMAVILVFAIEIINTAIEKTFDLLHPQEHNTIRVVKDAMAGAVFIAAIIAAVVFVLVFLPHIKNLF